MRAFGIAAVALVVVAGAAEAQVTATASAATTLEVVAGIAITSNSGLNFGNIAPEEATITLDAEGNRTTTGTVAITGTASPASFAVTGFTGAEFSITSTATTLTRDGGGTIAFTPTLYGGPTNVAADADAGVSSGEIVGGNYYIFVGGTINVPANPPVGTYNGTVGVTVTYTSI